MQVTRIIETTQQAGNAESEKRSKLIVMIPSLTKYLLGKINIKLNKRRDRERQAHTHTHTHTHTHAHTHIKVVPTLWNGSCAPGAPHPRG